MLRLCGRFSFHVQDRQSARSDQSVQANLVGSERFLLEDWAGAFDPARLPSGTIAQAVANKPPKASLEDAARLAALFCRRSLE
jgi:hypothetical protein